jgi:hypothetical protein
MGADLICYIAFGPARLRPSDRRIAEVGRQTRMYLYACITAAERLILGEKEVPDPFKGQLESHRGLTLRLGSAMPDDMPRFTRLDDLRAHAQYEDLVRGILVDCGRDVAADHVFDAEPETLVQIVKEFVEAWNDGLGRDGSSRIDPRDRRRKVVVAGELSWGDEPEGTGYQTLKKAFGLMIAQRLGVK